MSRASRESSNGSEDAKVMVLCDYDDDVRRTNVTEISTSDLFKMGQSGFWLAGGQGTMGWRWHDDLQVDLESRLYD